MKIHYCDFCMKEIENYDCVEDVLTIYGKKTVQGDCCSKCMKIFDRELAKFLRYLKNKLDAKAKKGVQKT